MALHSKNMYSLKLVFSGRGSPEQDCNACAAVLMASYDSKVTLKSTFNLVSAAGGMLAGAQNAFFLPRGMRKPSNSS